MCGDGGSGAAKVLGLLGLPNDTTMEKRLFGIIEDRISWKIQAAKILLENLTGEVRLSLNASFDENDFNLWKNALTDKTVVVTRYPKVVVSYDMAWQQRNSGHVYASPSGHAFFVSKFNRKPLSLVIKSKKCSYCAAFAKKNPGINIPINDCTKSQPIGCLEMVEAMYTKFNCIVDTICIDDNA
jgi:hypothetical protein